MGEIFVHYHSCFSVVGVELYPVVAGTFVYPLLFTVKKLQGLPDPHTGDRRAVFLLEKAH